MTLSDHDLQNAIHNLAYLDPVQKARVLQLLEERDRLKKLDDARQRFIPFVKEVWPGFIPGAHHTLVGEAFEKIIAGKSKRLIINMAPRHTKSELASVMLPAWYLGKRPSKKIIQVSNTEALASGFGRRVRNMIGGDTVEGVGEVRSTGYADIFPGVKLAEDSKAAAGWHTNFGGEYFAIGTSGRVTGKGADCAYFSCRCLTKRGYLPIADVQVGDEVLGYDHTQRTATWTKVRAISTQRKPELVNINGFLCTPEHRVYTRRGYQRALAVGTYSDNVLTVPEGFRARFDGVSSSDPKNWQAAYAPILFGRVPAQPSDLQMPRVRRLEGPDGDHLQELLPEGQARLSDMQALRQRHQAPAIRAHEKHRAIRGQRKCLLQPHLLSGAQSSSATEAENGYRGVRKVRETGASAERQVLLDEMLRGAGAKVEQALHREMEPGAPPNQGAFQGGVCDVRPSESARAGAPYRPRCDTSPQTEPSSPVRALSRVLSSSDDGRCARDYESSLSGTGHWVVDLQTDAQNFFCEGVLAHNCLIIDDPHSEQEAKQAEYSPAIFDGVYDWFTSGPRQRLQPGGAIIIVMTRWSRRDLSGRLIDKMQQRAANDSGDQWEVIELPAILDEGQPTERPMWPGFWSLKELQDTREEIGPLKFRAQYQQALEVSTPIPTPTGWTTMRDLKIGDEVWGSDGKPTKVVWKSERYVERPLYRVTSDDNAEVYADAGHLWTVKLNRADNEPRTYRTDLLAARQVEREHERPLAPRRPRLPEPVAWDLPARQLPIDPWVLGVWLGDGNRSQAIINGHEDDAPFMRAEFERRGFVTTDQTDPQTFGVLGLRQKLRLAGQLNNKHIPAEYLRASYAQRLDLLRGLVDTDGTVSLGRSAFASVHKHWADQVCELVLSLGAKSFIKRFKLGHFNSDGSVRKSRTPYCYKVEFYLPGSALLPRKAEQMRGKKTKHGRFLRFDLAGTGDTQCIRVANPDGLFLAGRGALLTHNCPTSEQSAILKREYWRIWGEDKEADLKSGHSSCPGPQHATAWAKLDPPACEFIIQSWDCASTKNDRSHPSAMTEWGVFKAEDPSSGKTINNIILLSAYKARMEFPELKKKAKQFYEESQPDSLLIENKSAGMQLLQEFRSMGIPAEDFAGSSRGSKALPNDKIARANLIADIFASGYVWMPDRRFAEDVRIQCAEFPNGMEDDLVDSTVQALLRFRAGGLIRTANDEEDERDQPRARRRRYY